MKTALVISSFVSASRVGATASAFCLRRLGVETMILPTTLLGRHPGWGTPGGGPVDAAHLSDMWTAISAQDLPVDGVLTGYMARPEHVMLAARIIDDLRDKNPDLKVLVDPVMGDHGRLYVSELIAQNIAAHLLPRGDLVTPNVWELEYLSGGQCFDITATVKHARGLHPSVMVTSVPFGHAIGATYVSKDAAFGVSHQKFKTVPHGGGDSFAGLVLGHWLCGRALPDALARSVSTVYEIISLAVQDDAGELALVRHQEKIVGPTQLSAKPLSMRGNFND